MKTFFKASDVKGKWGPPVTFSPSLKKGTTRLQCERHERKITKIQVKKKTNSRKDTKQIASFFDKRKDMHSEKGFYANSTGVAMILANITVGAWQVDPSTAIATPQRNTGTPILKPQNHLKNKIHYNLNLKM